MPKDNEGQSLKEAYLDLVRQWARNDSSVNPREVLSPLIGKIVEYPSTERNFLGVITRTCLSENKGIVLRHIHEDGVISGGYSIFGTSQLNKYLIIPAERLNPVQKIARDLVVSLENDLPEPL